MRKISICMLFALMSTTVLAYAQQASAPDFVISHQKLPDKLSSLKGQVVYLDFWASWCKPCRKSFPWMNQMQQKYAAQGLQIIAINLDTEKALAQEFLDKVPANMPIIYDPQGNIASDYKLVGMPSSYLIDKKGNIRFSHKGFFTASLPKYEQELVLLLNESE